MRDQSEAVGRRERAKADKRRRIIDSARSLFVERGIAGVTTQQVSERADVAIGTLFRYASTKAELLIMVQNGKFSAAIDAGGAASRQLELRGAAPIETVMALLSPVIDCVREQPENGRMYLHELIFGDPAQEHRRAGLAEAQRLEEALAGIFLQLPRVDRSDAATLARVVTSIVHVTMTATLHLHDSPVAVRAIIRSQLEVVIPRAPEVVSVTAREEGRWILER